jgi:protein ImuA
MNSVAKKNTIAQLQRTILAMQHISMQDSQGKLGLGVIEDAFPEQTFHKAAVHEFVSYSREDIAATNGFLAALTSKLMPQNGYCLWVGASPNIYAPALQQFNIPAEQIIFVRSLKDKESLWIMEEALKCPALSAVIADIPNMSFTASRRLQLAVENSKTTGLIHRHYPNLNSSIAAVSRWHISPLPSTAPHGLPGLGHPTWAVELLKVRNGRPGNWHIHWNGNDFMLNTATNQAATKTNKNWQYYG